MRTHECTKTVGSQLHRTGTSIISFTPTNGQNAGDLMPNACRWEKGPKCGSLPLNAGELAALTLFQECCSVPLSKISEDPGYDGG